MKTRSIKYTDTGTHIFRFRENADIYPVECCFDSSEEPLIEGMFLQFNDRQVFTASIIDLRESIPGFEESIKVDLNVLGFHCMMIPASQLEIVEF